METAVSWGMVRFKHTDRHSCRLQMCCGHQGGNLARVAVSEHDTHTNTHTPTHTHTHTHSKWFTVLTYNPIYWSKVSLKTWQRGPFIYYLATRHHIYSPLSRAASDLQEVKNSSRGQNHFPRRRGANRRRPPPPPPNEPRLPIMLCSGSMWEKKPSLRQVVRCHETQWRHYHCVCVCVCVCVCSRWWCINYAVVRRKLE